MKKMFLMVLIKSKSCHNSNEKKNNTVGEKQTGNSYEIYSLFSFTALFIVFYIIALNARPYFTAFV